jgi:acyl-CoA synthetase (AMP-forming)/AMP-acid ligase II
VGAGDRVLIRHPNARILIALVYGVSRAGAVLVPVSPTLSTYQLRQVAADAEPALALASAGDVATMAGSSGARPVMALDEAWGEIEASAYGSAAETVSPDDLAVLFYTSGSTASPKGVMCPHRQVTFAAAAIASRLRYAPQDKVFCRVPLSFDYGLYQSLLCCIGGSELLVAPAGDAALLRWIRRWAATVVPVVPSLAQMLAGLAGRDSRPTQVRLFTNTGAHLPATTVAALRHTFPGAKVSLMFGLTECKRVSILDPDGDAEHPGSVGIPLHGTRVDVVDQHGRPVPAGTVGEFVVTGPHVTDGYWRAPELTARRFTTDPATGQRALRTGDYGYLDADGHLYFVGRRDDVFKRNGVRTSTTEIEAAALDVPGVAAAAALPPGPHGDLALAAVAACTADELVLGLRARLEPAKVPARCHLMSALPMTGNGKVDRARLAELIAGPDHAPALAARSGGGAP